MSTAPHFANESKAAEAFTKQSFVFDSLYIGDSIIQYKRQRVREHVQRYLKPNSLILELNCGTGEDAIFFAQQQHKVHATDISKGMLKKLEEKVSAARLSAFITSEECSYTQLNFLHNKGPFDHIFSNFGGLNCTGELDKVLRSFDPLLKPGGTITLVIISKFCLWEFLLLFKWKLKAAFRRFFSRRGRTAHIEGAYFRCWYYSPSYVTRHLKKDFDVRKIEGLCTLVPPSYFENFARKYPKAFAFLSRMENKYAAAWPWKLMGDYFIVSLQKK